VKVLVENHTGYTTTPAAVAEIVRKVDHPFCRSLADWGNSAGDTTSERIADLALLFPTLALVSAKGIAFDTAYRHVGYDIAPLVKASEAAGFRGIYSVELYPARGSMPPPDALLAARSLVATIAQAIGTG
ncbi:MAG TPA: TIM barrel protein, partial [Sphingomonas sp.]|nr:TIM barrel protein [Sphingomonas sp.]